MGSSSEYVTLILDAKNLASKQIVGMQRDLKKMKDEGDRAGIMLKRIGTVASGIGGATLGMMFASAANGAVALNQATAEFTAQTGASDAQAKEFTKTLIALDKTNVQSVPEIGAALTELQTNFKLSGDAAKSLGAQFLDFSRVAGGTASESVLRFDELVDSGVITVDQMAVTMDKLIASHQKFGVNINDTIAALVKFAPAMTAAGISTDEALGLMNMFSEAGLNAETASKAFNIALGKVKSPEELKALMLDISGTSDDFARGQKAAALFGQRAGVQLANALKPGSGGIDAWTVKAGEFTGATTKAGDALDSSFGNQAALKLKEFNGALAEIGTNMGDLLMVAALLGPGFTRAFGVIGGGIAGALAAGLKGAIGGASFASWLGAAAGWALTGAAIILPVALAVDWIGSAIDANTRRDWGTKLATDAKARGMGLKPGAPETRGTQGPRTSGAPGDLGVIYKPQPDLIPIYATSGKTAGQAFKDGLASILRLTGDTAATAAAAKAGAAIGLGLIGGVRQYVGDMRQTMVDAIAGVRAAIIAGKAGLVSAWTDALNARNRAADIKDELLINRSAQTAQRAIINSKKSSAAEIAQAHITLRGLQTAHSGLLVEQTQYGTRMAQIAHTKALLASKELKDGLKSKDPDIKAYWAKVKADAELQLGRLRAEAKGYGMATIANYAAGLRSQTAKVALAMGAIASTVDGHIHAGSPTRLGPLSKMSADAMGAKLVNLFAGGMASQVAAVRNASGMVGGAALFEGGGTLALAGSGGSAGGMGNVSIHLHVNSTWPPTNQQVAQMADTLDAELRRRFTRHSPYQRRG